ncbi:hypothetical protein CAOG_010160 [Capsaspora owczarzaki ATCC 30864]|uniref:Uncharacterized protein n=1 Tax=Capsaspora owczarzaki (strain ATCC 30864) TaxID=595528 RepID=A0A0D2WY91_CAPO3|nr:hypothetical protein CAOG_010160 [Capsaspora owczarzaki ATCC 30864]
MDRVTNIQRCPHCHKKLPVVVQAVPDGNDIPDSWRNSKLAAKQGWEYELPEFLRATMGGVGALFATSLYAYGNGDWLYRLHQTRFARHKILGSVALGVPAVIGGAAVAGVAYGATPALFQFCTRLYQSGYLKSNAFFEDSALQLREKQQAAQQQQSKSTEKPPTNAP